MTVTSFLRRRLPISALLLLMAARPALAGFETSGEQHWWLHADVSTFGGHIDRLFYGILYLTVGICAAVFVTLVVFLIRYRHQPGRAAKFIHGNNKLEAVWTLVPTVILALIAAVSQKTWSEVKTPWSPPTPREIASGEVVEVEVVGYQFNWAFHYPGGDGKLGQRRLDLIDINSPEPAGQIGLDRGGDGRDDLVTSRLVLPVDRKVLIRLTSRDVIHSFFLPNFRLKQDAVPGLNSRLWLQATQTSGQIVGTVDPDAAMAFDKSMGLAKPFDIVCAELCGQGHFKMRGQLYVVADSLYRQFIEDETKKLQLDTPGQSGAGGDAFGF